MRSLRVRLVVGMLLGMAGVLLASGITVYAAQARQLYRAFDESLINNANALALLLHQRREGIWFDFAAKDSLADGAIRAGLLFQFWGEPMDADYPPEPRPDGPDFDRGEPRRPPPDEPGPPRERRAPRRESGLAPLARRLLPLMPPGPPWAVALAEPGARVIRAPSLGDADLPQLSDPAGGPRYANLRLPNGHAGRALGMRFPVRAGGPPEILAPRSEALVVVAADTAEIVGQLSFLGTLLAATALGAMALSVGVAWLVVGRGLAPLKAVARQIAAIDASGLKLEIAQSGAPREVEPVVRQLNALLRRLDAAFERERTLSADIAHELRTPLAGIRSVIEITLSRSRAGDEYEEALRDTLRIAVSLHELVEKLLTLARLESAGGSVETQPVALGAAVFRQWAGVEKTAREKRLTCGCGIPDDVLVVAEPRLLDLVLANVLDNAARYTPDGGRIDVGTRSEADHLIACFANTGCELTSEQTGHVFERFWRADASRTSVGLHCGLGLTLVRRAMEVMGGRAEACVRDGRFELMLHFRAVQTT